MEFKLTDIIKNQAILNVGFIGSVSHGKSTTVERLTGTKTQKHSKELERNITINLGYANIKIYYNEEIKQFSHKEYEGYKLYRHISFVDCPGHKALAATMISGSRVMNAAILLVALNESIPQPQTQSHTEVLKHTDINNVLIVPNKIDLLSTEKDVQRSVQELSKFIDSNKMLKDKNVVPISAYKNINIEHITRFLSTIPPTNINENVNKEFNMYVLRSFDINYVSTQIDNLKGGVIGGSIQSGYIEIGDTVLISPGIVKNGVCRPIVANVVSIFSEKTPLEIAFPGGLVALGLDCDPSLCKQNLLLGNSIIKLSKTRPEISVEFTIEIEYLKEPSLFKNLTNIIILVNSRSIKAKIKKKKDIINNKQMLLLTVDIPIVINYDDTFPIMTLISDTVDLYAFGKIKEAISHCEVIYPTGIEQLEIKQPKEIKIIDDLPKVSFDKLHFTLDNLKSNIIPYIRDKKKVSIILPEITINKDTTRIVWVNYTIFSQLFDNIEQNIDSNIKLFGIKNIIGGYIRYIYNIDESSISGTNETIIVHIRTRGLKTKLDNTIKTFFEKYYKCIKCNDYTCRLGKIGSKISKVCFECCTKNMLNEPWLKSI
jgi:translation initiation factor 2 subunit 3